MYGPAKISVEITYSPGTGVARVSDQWHTEAGPSSLSLVVAHNVMREGREGVYRALRETVGQYFDILDARWQEDPTPF